MTTPQKVSLSPITPKFLEWVRSVAAGAEDSVAKRFIEKLYAKGDKAVTAFFARLKHVIDNNVPLETRLYGFEKKLLSDACEEYAAARVQRLEKKAGEEPLKIYEEMELHLLDRRLEPPVEYQRWYNRRQWLGTGIQLGAILVTPLLMQGAWHADEEQRQKDLKKRGHDRSGLYNAYCKAADEGKALLAGVFLFVAGEIIKPIGITPATVWNTKGRELMDGLNKILVPVQAMQEKDNSKGK